MEKVVLGSTGMTVGRIGLGALKFGRNFAVQYPNRFGLPSTAFVSDLLSRSQELGINIVDTAPSYGSSEEVLGLALRGRRHDWIISTKVGEMSSDDKVFYDFSKDGMIRSVRSSLKSLNTEYVDILLLHTPRDELSLLCRSEVIETLLSFKRSGIARAIGVSSRTVLGGHRALDFADVLMVAINPGWQEERGVIRHALELGVGVIAKKVFNSGRSGLLEPDAAGQTLRFVTRQIGVHCAVVSTLSYAHLEENVGALC